jgi:hypothetical protein
MKNKIPVYLNRTTYSKVTYIFEFLRAIEKRIYTVDI